MRTCLAAFVLLGLTTIPALAFDCTKAKTAVEKAICAEPELKQVDDALATAYVALKSSLAPEDQKMLTASERRWVANREYCAQADEGLSLCVKQRTEERLRLLEGRPESGPGVGTPLVPVFLVQQGTPELYDIDMTLLRFADVTTLGKETLNRITEETLASAKLGPHGEDTQGAIFAQQDSFSLTYASPQLISVHHAFYVNEGGAHGNFGTANFNIDMETGKLLEAKDILPEPSAAILTLWCKKQIEAEKKKRVPDIDLSEEAAERDKTIAEQVRNLGSWSIGEKEIVVSFDPYAVGTYAEGAYECRFPTAGVKQMAREGALLP
jgi:uncharacterized protein YecT (DUF1311 family)